MDICKRIMEIILIMHDSENDKEMIVPHSIIQINSTIWNIY